MGDLLFRVVGRVRVAESRWWLADSSVAGWNALQIARQEFARGAGETLGDNLGPDIDRYRAVTHASAGASWCASFVSFCFDKANPGAMPFVPEAGARALLKEFQDKGWDYQASVDSPPAPGDIIVWWRESLASWKGHIGLIASYEHGIIKTIEGTEARFPPRLPRSNTHWARYSSSWDSAEPYREGWSISVVVHVIRDGAVRLSTPKCAFMPKQQA